MTDLCPICGHATDHLKSAVLFDPDTGMLVLGGKVARLSPSESRAFAVLWKAFPEHVGLERLHIAVYPSTDDEPPYAENTVKVFLHHLRKRIAPLGMSVENIFSIGYRLKIAALTQG